MRVVVSGSSGHIGTALKSTLRADGHEVTALVRRPAGDHEATWDPARGSLDVEVLRGADAVVNLNGASIGEKRWSAAQKERIRESRVAATSTLASAIATVDAPPSVFVTTSAVGYYGSTGDEPLDERAPQGFDFLAEVCGAWEQAAQPARDSGVRTVTLRSGVVLSAAAPPLSRMLLGFKLGLGGRVGSGRQWMSWISMVDSVRVIRRAIEDSALAGPVNACAPEPVRQKEFARTLGAALGRPTLLPTPTFALKAAFGGELVQHLLVEGQRVEPVALQAVGFDFTYPDLDSALRATLA